MVSQGGAGSERTPAGTPIRAGMGRAIEPGVAERIHDGPLQDLAAIAIKLAALQRASRGCLEPEVAELKALVDSASRELRAILGEGAADMPCPDLWPQLRELCSTFAAETGIRCHAHLCQEHTDFDPATGDLVYRSIRELLTNVRKHSGAGSVSVSSASRPNGDLVFSVTDDGVGISGDLSPSRFTRNGAGFGLWSIEHRLKSCGGRMELHVERGLSVSIVLPRRLPRSAF